MKRLINKIVFFNAFVFLTIGQVRTQDIPSSNYFREILPANNIFSAPDVSAFHKVNNLPTNLYTGKIEINIPIYEIETGNIKLPISLSYNSGGIKIDDESSSVGMGWCLNAGGSVVKIIKDIEDHDYTSDVTKQNTSLIRRLSSKGLLSEDVINLKTSKFRTDAYPDLFIVNGGGLSNKFYFEKTQNNEYIANTLNGQKLKIHTECIKQPYDNVVLNNIGFDIKYIHKSHSQQINFKSLINKSPDYSFFHIINTNGLKYFFEDKDIGENIPNGTGQIQVDPSGQIDYLGNFIYNNYSLRYTAWHLSKIEDKVSNRNILFSYESFVNNRVIERRTYAYNNYLNKEKNPFSIPYGFNYQDFELGYQISNDRCYNIKNTITKKIQKIIWDGGNVDFIYQLNREDVIGDRALTEICVKDRNNKIIKHFLLTYDYLKSKEQNNTPECKRLILSNIYDISDGVANKKQLYSFEYDKSEALPMVRSLEQDYLGYYNKQTKIIDGSVLPILYFHPNNGKYSILPFNLGNSYPLTSNGYSLESSIHSLAGLLKKITYATGGVNEFEYENHRFNILGKEVLAGGARIKRQIIRDGENVGQIIDYEYCTEEGKTSGAICNMPKYGQIVKSIHIPKRDPVPVPVFINGKMEIIYQGGNDESSEIGFVTFNRSNSEIELTDGSFVGYSRVLEKSDLGIIEHQYTTSLDYPNEEEVLTKSSSHPHSYLRQNSLYPGIAYTDNDARRGKLIQKTIRNNEGKILQIDKNTYENKIIEKKYIELELPNGLKYKTGLNIETELLVINTNEENYNENKMITIKNYEYDPNYFYLTKEVFRSNLNDLVKLEYVYPPDIKDDLIMVHLVNDNRIDKPVDIKKSTNECSSLSSYRYAMFKGIPQLSVLKTRTNIDNVFKSRVQYYDYDQYGNPIYVSKNDGVKVVCLWSYSGQYPIVEIKNATYQDIETALGKTLIDRISTAITPSEADIKAINDLRKNTGILKDAHITTYTYQPLIGILTATDPSGTTIYYEYDTSGRLKRTKDADAKTIQEYDYHYQNQ
ncbi:MAG: RHS repeat protein [Prevotella sp.]|jgi:YD repeat-containing protein|nr:RHS repeat protein [Prevotella sp.]